LILIDANILIYAYNSSANEHAAARAWLEEAFSNDEQISLPWSVIHAFLRLMTSGRVLPVPVAMEIVVGIVEEWLSLPHVLALEPGPRYFEIFRRHLVDGQVRGNLVNDAHLAALATEYDATVCTADSDFSRFDGLRVINPLA